MNILFLSHRVPFPPNKGEKIRTFNQLKFLGDSGHNIHVLAPFEEEQELDFFKTLEQQYCQVADGVKLSNKLLRLSTGLVKGKALSVANFYSKNLQQTFDKLVKNKKFDAIVCTASSMAEYIFKSHWLAENPCPALLMDFMDLDSDKWRQYSERSTLPMKWVYQRETRLISKFEINIAERFDACFFITNTEKELFNKGAPNTDNIFAVENGMDTQTFKPALLPIHSEQPVLLFTGVMNYAPNVDAVVWFVENAWSQVLAKWPEAKFYIVGMSPSDKVNNLSKQKGIIVTGFVDDILPYFHQATIFIGPFRIARGVQNKVLQAFACGIPVISTKMGAEGIRCKDKESILLANTPEDFINEIATLTLDKALSQKIAGNALAIIQQHYAWEGVLAPFDRVLNEVTSVKVQNS
ncbi:TIGR03087 family PEP-CTERM/XrtA system glycosyltransferase [Paraglaciecola marina]|uniref:TIGR03087 family PEP-CTERM/XrtA system glycosyltransferase n=1 Tax=Paraglaciecola marina TaxID=2500157 RepID=UPI001060293F|nr:TIGR03087 family PEP-CTERM/XrtA system glycosyltransferase [Paraglaciecola marina]